MENMTVVTEVLLRLPVKSLFRCKCLSKKWNNFISYDASFRKNYLLKLKASSPRMLGFFYARKPSPKLPKHLVQPVDQDQVRFLPTSTQGIKLKSGDFQTWGAPPPPNRFDESLRFIGHERIYIVVTSSGYILCCLEETNPMNYYVCNPITKDYVALPKPSMTSTYLPTGFICQASHPWNFKVVRGIWIDGTGFTNKLTIEIFSSDSFEWKVFNLTCSTLFRLEVTKPFVGIDKQGVVHWSVRVETFIRSVKDSYTRGVLAFDQTKEGLQLVALPREVRRHYSECFSQSDGHILYARHDLHELEVWFLRDRDACGKEWSLKFNVNVEPIMRKGPRICTPSHKSFDIIAFHPFNPLGLFMWKEGKVASYNVVSSRLELVSDSVAGWESWGVSYILFPYVWPTWPPFFP